MILERLTQLLFYRHTLYSSQQCLDIDLPNCYRHTLANKFEILMLGTFYSYSWVILFTCYSILRNLNHTWVIITQNCVRVYHQLNEAEICPFNFHFPSINLVNIVLPINVGQISPAMQLLLPNLLGKKLMNIQGLLRVRAREIRIIWHISYNYLPVCK